MERKEYIISTYGCSEASWQHWDKQDQLHNGSIPGTATETLSKQKVIKETIPTKEVIEPKKTRGRPKNV